MPTFVMIANSAATCARQPQAQRQRRRLDREHDQQQQPRGLRECEVGGRQAGEADIQIGEVERAGNAVEHRGCDQEQP
jgi:hypothetical protein